MNELALIEQIEHRLPRQRLAHWAYRRGALSGAKDALNGRRRRDTEPWWLTLWSGITCGNAYEAHTPSSHFQWGYIDGHHAFCDKDH